MEGTGIPFLVRLWSNLPWLGCSYTSHNLRRAAVTLLFEVEIFLVVVISALLSPGWIDKGAIVDSRRSPDANGKPSGLH